MPSRRAILASAGTALAVGSAGCLGGDGYDDAADAAGDATDWPMAGHDSNHTRYIPDGTAITDGVSERWRVEVDGGTAEPVVAGDTVLATVATDVVAFDVESGERRWSVEDDNQAASYWAAPAVADGTAYVGGDDALRAIEVESGEQVWERTVATDVTAAPTLGTDGRELFVAFGETVARLDPETGESEWERRLFGRVEQSLAVDPPFVVAVTRGGDVYALSTSDGDGFWRTGLPDASECVPTIADQRVYVGCFDGRVYAMRQRGQIEWDTDIGGFAKGGIGVADGTVYADGGRELHALSADGGGHQWRVGVGTIGGHPPVVVDDTVYVGGDRLRALRPGGGVGVRGIRVEPTRFSADLAEVVGHLSAADGSLYVHLADGDERVLVRLDAA
jgi:outer membrane protein assembly factor BamB